jgi:hypothetical protein
MKTPGAIRLIAMALLLAVFGAGCGDKTPNPRALKAAAAAAKPAPERSFDIIMESFRHSMEDTRIGFVMYDKGGHSMLVGHRKVSEELIRPTKEGEPYKAIITVTSESRYSMSRAQGEPEGEEKKPESEANHLKSDEGTADESGVEVLDPNLVAKPGDNGQRNTALDPAKSTVSRRPDVDTRKYELIYEDGRWTLVTKLDLKTEQSIQHAFDVALRTQS